MQATGNLAKSINKTTIDVPSNTRSRIRYTVKSTYDQTHGESTTNLHRNSEVPRCPQKQLIIITIIVQR